MAWSGRGLRLGRVLGGWLRLERTGNGRGLELEIGSEVESDVGAGPGNGR